MFLHLREPVLRWAGTLPPETKGYLIMGYKMLIVAVVLFITGLLWRLLITGRLNARYGYASGVTEKHKHTARRAGWTTLVLILLVEGGVQLRGSHAERDALFWVHLVFAAIYAISLGLMLWRFSGEHRFHKWFAYTALLSFVVAMVLGIPMLFTRF